MGGWRRVQVLFLYSLLVSLAIEEAENVGWHRNELVPLLDNIVRGSLELEFEFHDDSCEQ
jgi:hypothetical protein